MDGMLVVNFKWERSRNDHNMAGSKLTVMMVV
jgi:hypothetical protein